MDFICQFCNKHTDEPLMGSIRHTYHRSCKIKEIEKLELELSIDLTHEKQI